MITTSIQNIQDRYFHALFRKRLPIYKDVQLVVLNDGFNKPTMELRIRDNGYVLTMSVGDGLLDYGVIRFVEEMIDKARRDNPWPGMEYTP